MYPDRQPEVFHHMAEEQPSRLLRGICIKCRYKNGVLRKSIHNKDRFKVTNL